MNLSKPSGYRADIDGLRAFAIIPVVMYHLGLSFPGGYVGVDVFFVISGFLITGIIYKELEQGRFSIAGFYERRAKRILPALSFMLLGVLLTAWFVFLPYEMEQLGKHLTQVSAFLSNIWLHGKAGDYWSPRAEDLPLLHTWSLAVEEQFYVVMPLLMMALFRWQRKHLHTWLLLIFAASLIYSIDLSFKDPASAFYLLPSRTWELLLGSLVFLYTRNGLQDSSKSTSLLNHIFGLSGLGLIIGSYFIIDRETVFPGYAVLAPTLGAALVICSNSSSPNIVGRILSWQPFRITGLISYSLYLWHWPAIVFLKAYRYPENLSKTDQFGIIIGSTVLATLSWFLIEQPFRRKRKKGSPYFSILVGSGALCCFIGISLFIRKTDGYPQRFKSWVSPTLYNVIRSDVLDKSGSNKFQAGSRFISGGIQINTSPERTPEVVIFGDSHGAMFAPVFDEIIREYEKPAAFFTQDGYNPVLEMNYNQQEALKAHFKKWVPKKIFMVMRWDGLWQGAAQDQKTIEKVTETIHWLSSSCQQLYVTLQAPMIAEDNQRSAKIIFNQARRNNQTLPNLIELNQSRHGRERTTAFLQSLTIKNLEILDLSTPYLEGQQVLYHSAGHLFYRDNDHLNLLGALRVKDLLLKAIVPDDV